MIPGDKNRGSFSFSPVQKKFVSGGKGMAKAWQRHGK
jgi:hypothetical protein